MTPASPAARSAASPLFILGFGRSGTKLLRSILCNHPGVRIPDIETNFLPLWARLLPSYRDLAEPQQFARFFGMTRRLPFFQYAAARGREIAEQAWYERAAPYDLPALFESLIKLYEGFDERRDLVWGDKSPTYVSHVGFLREQFPRARFVHIVRDARDCCLSAIEAWGSHPYRMAQRWNDAVVLPSRDLQADADALLEVRYEDLLRDPQGTTARVFAFVGLDFGAELLVSVESGEEVGRASQSHVILSTNVHRYRTEMSAPTAERIARIAATGLSHFDYETPFAQSVVRISGARMALYRLRDGLKHVRRRLAEEGLRPALRFVGSFFRQNLASERQRRARRRTGSGGSAR